MIKSKSTPRPTKFVSSSINLANDSAMREEGAEQIEEEKKEKEEQEPKQRIEKQQQKWNGEEEEVIKDKAYYARIRRQRKQASKRKRELASMMGVGQLLDHARRKFATEDGELDVSIGLL
jgi:ribosome-binding protein aMBF1 (putative translation factor)